MFLGKSCDQCPLFLWQTLTCQIPAGNTTQQRGNSPGCSWSVWEAIPDTTGEGTRQGRCPTGSVNRGGLVGDVIAGDPPGHSEHEIRGFVSWGDGGVAAEFHPGLLEGRLCLGAGLAESRGWQP